MQPLSVIQVISSPWWTGAADPTLSLALELGERGHRVHFVCVPGEELEKKAIAAGMPPVEGLEPTRNLNPIRIWKFVSGLAALIRQVEADVVHTHLTADHWLGYLAIKWSRRNARLVRTVHHQRAAGVSRLAKFLLGRATNAVIAVNHYLANVLLNRSDVSPDSLHVVPGGVDVKRFRPAGIETRAAGRTFLQTPPNTLLIGIVSRLAADRGYYSLFSAFEKVAEKVPNVRLVVIGKGEFLPRLEERVRSLGIEDRVDFAGYYEEELVEVLAALDIFTLMAPGSEGTCRAVLEAMAMGLPCVVTDRNGLAEIVEDAVTARVVPVGLSESIDMMTSAFMNLLSDKQRRYIYGQAGRERVEKFYSRQKRAESVEKVYAHALDLEPEPDFAGDTI